jgi:hypothetical protein
MTGRQERKSRTGVKWAHQLAALLSVSDSRQKLRRPEDVGYRVSKGVLQSMGEVGKAEASSPESLSCHRCPRQSNACVRERP